MSPRRPVERYRNICFTSFSDNEPNYDESIMSYLVYGLELCPETGKWHWQGYCEFRHPIGRKRINSQVFVGAHIEKRYGSAEEAALYCCKGGEYVEHGSISRQGSRSDLDCIARTISEGSSLSDVANEHPRLFVQYGRGLQFLHNITQAGRQRIWRNVQVEIWWGGTRTGKTRTFFAQYGIEDSYRFKYNVGNDYWDGYYGQKHILFDEFESQVLLSNMLVYMDGHPLPLNVKQTHTYANYETVTIISNSNPQTFYHNCSTERRAAFAARVSRVIEYANKDTRIISEQFQFANNVFFVTDDRN